MNVGEDCWSDGASVAVWDLFDGAGVLLWFVGWGWLGDWLVIFVGSGMGRSKK